MRFVGIIQDSVWPAWPEGTLSGKTKGAYILEKRLNSKVHKLPLSCYDDQQIANE